MWGAIVGDVVGSAYERAGLKSVDFELFTGESRFTDDTVLTVAVADALLSGRDYGQALADYGRRYFEAGFSSRFRSWILSGGKAWNDSWGNGSAMRVSPVGWAFETVEEVLAEAERSAAVSHGHPEGIRAAQAVASSVFLARKGADREELKAFVEARFGYDLSRSLDAIRPTYRFSAAAAESVPEALCAFLESTDYEDALRRAVSLGGDADTQAAIAGAVAEAFYGAVPEPLKEGARLRLTEDLLAVIDAFVGRYGP